MSDTNTRCVEFLENAPFGLPAAAVIADESRFFDPESDSCPLGPPTRAGVPCKPYVTPLNWMLGFVGTWDWVGIRYLCLPASRKRLLSGKLPVQGRSRIHAVGFVQIIIAKRSVE
jgi:hypothetical protein